MYHYHATGCSGGAFSWRAAMLNPHKALVACHEPREYRQTTLEDIRVSKHDKRRGGGPRVGPFQECIPGDSWQALPKYDFTTRRRSSAFNERMHVEWENHVDHILANGGKLPVASVVAKAGFRSCAPCCRDMLALARPTGKTFIMVDLAEDDRRGTFHFVTGDKYLPVPKEALGPEQVACLKKIVADAQDGRYPTSNAIHEAVVALNVPLDEEARALYLGDRALLPPGCGAHLRGAALLEVLHAEHFARLSAEYGASIMRDADRPSAQREAVLQCRALASEMLVKAWRPVLHDGKVQVELQDYAAAAVAPLMPEDPAVYRNFGTGTASALVPTAEPAELRATGDQRRWKMAGPGAAKPQRAAKRTWRAKLPPQGICEVVEEAACVIDDDDCVSLAAASTAVPPTDDGTAASVVSGWSPGSLDEDREFPEEENEAVF